MLQKYRTKVQFISSRKESSIFNFVRDLSFLLRQVNIIKPFLWFMLLYQYCVFKNITKAKKLYCDIKYPNTRQINTLLEFTLWIKEDFFISILTNQCFFISVNFHSTFGWSTEIDHNWKISFLRYINFINLNYFSWILENARQFIIKGQYDTVNEWNEDLVRNKILFCGIVGNFHNIAFAYLWFNYNIDTIGHEINFSVLDFL